MHHANINKNFQYPINILCDELKENKSKTETDHSGFTEFYKEEVT